MRRFLSLLILLLAASALSAQAQVPVATLTGVVTDASTGEPLPGASVFIAQSMTGTVSDANGRFTITGVPMGALRLYVSFVGFEAQYRDLLLREPRAYTFEFDLQPSAEIAGEAVVEAERDEKWQERYDRFVAQFIGETPNAALTTIQNPYVMSFEGSRLGTLEAQASEPLVIENRALGYQVTYYLTSFKASQTRTSYDGEPLYEELTPASQDEADVWAANRRSAFIGSFRHFLLAGLAGRLEGQGFKTYWRNAEQGAQDRIGSRRQEFDPNDLLADGEVPNEHILDTDDGFIEIIFAGEVEDPAYRDWWSQAGDGRITVKRDRFQTSWIRTENGPAIVDQKGDTGTPGVTLSGYLAFERVADAVPKEYRPGR